ncbi:MAG: LysM peptidoglycan-binding domain-containing protein, partial [Chitinivibrionales bacterium]|nr:LysM peptidoglycan-binding domain-containing protein [Chitinivibrionales bacterium]MBD3357695.1 LysM peptidoglycan-binding domain-containing protein [Chitinivibrionales bacterium]
MIAEKLTEIERDYGYETALRSLESLDYQAVNNLVELESPVNDPHLMPSRFMILKDATDEKLEAAGNLDAFPYPVHEHFPVTMSVQHLGELLTWLDFLEGTYPRWRVSDTENGSKTAREEQNVSGDAGDGSSRETANDDETEKKPRFTVMDQTLVEAMNKYIEWATEPDALIEEEVDYVVKAGDTLSSIAHAHGLKTWQLLYEANKKTIGDNPDLIKVDQSLKIPSTAREPIREWFKKNGFDTKYLSDKGYQYPGKYFSLSMIDENEDEPDPFEEPKKVELYRHTDKAEMVYEFTIDKADQISLVVPDFEGFGVYVR